MKYHYTKLIVFLFIIVLMRGEQINAQNIIPLKKVLVLEDHTAIRVFAFKFNDRLQTIFADNTEFSFRIMYEYMGLENNPSGVYPKETIDHLKYKLRLNQPDLVIGFMPATGSFISTYGHELFEGIPVIFAYSDPALIRNANSKFQIYSIPKAPDVAIKNTLEDIFTIKKDLHQLFIVSGVSKNDLISLQITKDAVHAMAKENRVTYLVGLTQKELDAQLSVLPINSAILMLAYEKDHNGDSPVIEEVYKNANAPIFSYTVITFGKGIVGGSLMSGEVYGQKTADLAIRILNGESISPVDLVENITVKMYDWRQLKRWGIDEKDLPANSAVYFKKYTIFEQYRVQIIGSILLIIIETTLIFLLLINISRRKKAEDHLRKNEESLKKSLSEKETLLRELYHRTKNTMQVIRGMLVLQSSDLTNNLELQKLVKDTENRIQAMSLVHQMLYKTQNLSHISIKEYIHDLSGLIMESFGFNHDLISLNISVNDEYFLLDTAIPFGLILNELMTNSLKYAFPDNRKGLINISLSRESSEKITFRYYDNGIGAPPGFNFKEQSTLGLKLIYNIGESQMQGEVSIENNNGVHCVIVFPDTLYQPRV